MKCKTASNKSKDNADLLFLGIKQLIYIYQSDKATLTSAEFQFTTSFIQTTHSVSRLVEELFKQTFLFFHIQCCVAWQR